MSDRAEILDKALGDDKLRAEAIKLYSEGALFSKKAKWFEIVLMLAIGGLAGQGLIKLFN